MFRTSRFIAVAVIAVSAIAPATDVAARGAPSTSPDRKVIAWFDGRWIDLTKGWGDAAACWSDGTTTSCFRSEAEMDRVIATERAAPLLLTSCSSSLRLYRLTGFAGGVLSLTTQNTFINLSAYGFDNDISSYRVGACGSVFYDGANGGSPTYPGATGAGASATSMAAGWDNRISSVYIT